VCALKIARPKIGKKTRPNNRKEIGPKNEPREKNPIKKPST
jgi:hypothetical protein